MQHGMDQPVLEGFVRFLAFMQSCTSAPATVSDRPGGGENHMQLPDCPFLLFGMGNRRKLLYRDAALLDAPSGDTSGWASPTASSGTSSGARPVCGFGALWRWW